jgi:acetate kinase
VEEADMPERQLLMTMNAGSSTVKIGVFERSATDLAQIAKGVVDLRTSPVAFDLEKDGETVRIEIKAEVTDDLHAVIDEVLALLADHFPMRALMAVGHRVVHGGETFKGPVRLDTQAIKGIAELIPLAPLHQPQALRLIRAIRHLRPDLVQTASFDTDFHRTQSDLVRRFAIPKALHDQGIKRYGFHGLSYQFIAAELSRQVPEFALAKVVAMHLGSGASLCAMDGGQSRDCSMGFSTLDGIPMATRSGNLDPGVLFHLLHTGKKTIAEIEDMLYHHSGLLGVSGLSADTRELLKDNRADAHVAIDLFALRIAGEIGRMCATLGGLDAIVFTGGIGEHQPEIRSKVCGRLTWLGLATDESANNANMLRISSNQSRIAAFVIPTSEEHVIARQAIEVLQEIVSH